MRTSRYHITMGHYAAGAAEQEGVPDEGVPQAMLDAASAATVAETLQALATPSRLLILSRLRRGACAVTQLAEEIGMEQSAVSHQLRLLRHLGLVVGTRQGKSTVYALYDNHVAMLLDQAVYHSEHLRLGLRDQVAGAVQTSAAEAAPAPR
jgi:DNA-binding transcriptional ArsR family regulator